MQQIYRRIAMLKCDFNKGMGILLYICHIFSEHLFLGTLLEGCFCTDDVSNLIKIQLKQKY